ncbi:GTPase domain-containing protein [Fontivita pretiosa]|uniref:GTPase domain-containing protein n=1 Tax=Fontivita pretiosa TaxID=2989684 RepID=UPI003D17E759
MSDEARQLVEETIALTGASPPALLEEDAPVLCGEPAGGMYLIGLVGGKDVGKSSLVNALVGQAITSPASHGAGTQIVVAYAHASVSDELKLLLDREVPGRYRIVPHHIDALQRQVLLDLPDIDSRYSDHVQITRRMLRHMLYPLWIQSIEKYADRAPQELLRAVAEGNDPANFVFCLNKIDQLVAREGTSAADELRRDYAQRIARVLELPSPPRVFAISAIHPDDHELPELRDMLATARPQQSVTTARELAARRQDRSLLAWLDKQKLDQRAEQLARLDREAGELAAARIAQPLLEVAIPRLLDDPGQRLALLEPAVRARLSRWPIISAIDTLLWPLVAIVQRNLGSAAGSPAAGVNPDAYLDPTQSLAASIQATFAQLQQSHPLVGELYRDRRLWEPLAAEHAAGELRRRFGSVLQRQRSELARQASSPWGLLLAPWRWLLTIGAVLWFPIVQPILSVMLQQDSWQFSKRTLRVIVDVLSVGHLLQCVTFLMLWFAILWVLLRWQAQRRIGRRIERYNAAQADEQLSLTGQTLQWLDELLEPIHQRRERFSALAQRLADLRGRLIASGSAESARAEVAAPS